MLIDTHAHIYMLENPELAIKEAQEAGVEKILIPASSEDEFDIILDLCEKFKNVYAILGVHPENCEKFNSNTLEKITQYSKNPKVKALGEIGLDYHYSKDNKDAQKKCFIQQLELAKVLNLPVVVHDRDAHQDTLEILKSLKMKQVVLHCFSGSVEFMKECCSLGYKISIGGVVTFKNAQIPKEVAKNVKDTDYMLETDCPYLTPHPFRGCENSPKYIGFVAKQIADLKNIPYDSIAFQTSKNAQEFFNLDKV